MFHHLTDSYKTVKIILKDGTYGGKIRSIAPQEARSLKGTAAHIKSELLGIQTDACQQGTAHKSVGPHTLGKIL